MKETLKEKELWTQQEVADYFRVVPGTVKNWRLRGLLIYWQPPGSKRVFYFRDDVKSFRDRYTNNPKEGKGGDSQQTEKIKGKPVISAKVQWRV